MQVQGPCSLSRKNIRSSPFSDMRLRIQKSNQGAYQPTSSFQHKTWWITESGLCFVEPESRRRPCQTHRQEVAVTEQRVVIKACLPVVTDSDLNFLFLWYIYTAEMYRYTPNNAEATPTKFFHNLTIVANLRCSIFLFKFWVVGKQALLLYKWKPPSLWRTYPQFGRLWPIKCSESKIF